MIWRDDPAGMELISAYFIAKGWQITQLERFPNPAGVHHSLETRLSDSIEVSPHVFIHLLTLEFENTFHYSTRGSNAKKAE